MTNQEEQTRYAKRLADALAEALKPVPGNRDAAMDKLAVKVGMRRRDALLYVALESVDPHPAPQILLPQLRDLLTQLKAELSLEWVKLVKVSGRLPTQPTPLWQEDLLINTVAPIAETLMRPVPTATAVATPAGLTPVQNGDVSVNVGGNFSGNLVIGDGNQLHNYTYNVAHGGVLNVASAPTVRARSTPLAVTPRPIPRLLDRQTVLPVLKKGLSQKLSVEVYAESGFGKTALMRHLSHEADIVQGFIDGVVYLPVGEQPAADLLQSLYDFFYEASPPFKPSYGQAQQALQIKDALVILDGLTLSKEQGEWLLNVLRGSAFVLVSPSEERIYWQEGESIALEGLPFPESTALIQIELGRALAESEKVASKKVWAAVAGNPLQLRRIAAQVKEKKQSLAAFAELIQQTAGDTQFVPATPENETTEQAAFRQIVATLTPKQKKMLALMGAMGGVALSAEQSLAISQVPEATQVLSELTQLHLLQATADGGYHLCIDLVQVVPQYLSPQSWLTQATAYFTQQGIAESGSSEAMLHLLEWTQSTGQWQSSLSLARSLDPALSLSGQWEQWHQVLTTSLQAAERAGDSSATGWAQHQLGTRSLALGNSTEAASLLSQALQLREQLGDFAGAAVSRHNLGLILPPLVAGGAGLVAGQSSQGETAPVRRGLTGGVAAIAGIIIAGSIATGLAVTQPWRSQPTGQLTLSENVIDFGARSLGSASDPRGITLTNSGQQSIQLSDISLDANHQDFRLDATSTCQVQLTLAVGESCELLAVFTPSAEGDRTAKITLATSAGDQTSDASLAETITLTGTGETSPLPGLTFDTSQLDFGEIVLGQTSQKTVKITNDGDAPLEISAIATIGKATEDYTVTSETCTETALSPNQDCSVVLSFEPKKVGERPSKLQVESNTDGDSELSLIGVGKAASQGDTTEPTDSLTAENDSATVKAADSVVIDVLGNDSEGAQLSEVASGSAGATEIRDGKVVYTHTGEGTRDRFTYTIRSDDGETAEATVTIQVESPSVPPPQANDDSATVLAERSVVIDVLENDSEGVTITSVGDGEVGATEVDDDEIIYTHSGEGARDRFTYTIENSAGETAKATVSITVESVPDPAPEANGDRATVTRGDSVTIDVLANDVDPAGGPLQIVDVQSSSIGGQMGVEGNQIIYYATGDGPRDSFTYIIENSAGKTAQATVSISIEPLQEAPDPLQANDDRARVERWGEVEIDVLANDSNPAGGRLRVLDVSDGQLGKTTITGNTITYYYEPQLIRDSPGFEFAEGDFENRDRRRYAGTLVQTIPEEQDSFTYTIGNGAGEMAQATVYITITSQDYTSFAK